MKFQPNEYVQLSPKEVYIVYGIVELESPGPVYRLQSLNFSKAEPKAARCSIINGLFMEKEAKDWKSLGFNWESVRLLYGR